MAHFFVFTQFFSIYSQVLKKCMRVSKILLVQSTQGKEMPIWIMRMNLIFKRSILSEKVVTEKKTKKYHCIISKSF